MEASVERGRYIVEVSARGNRGRYAVGIMNVEQALSLPKIRRFSFTHPDPAKAAAGVLVNRKELAHFVLG